MLTAHQDRSAKTDLPRGVRVSTGRLGSGPRIVVRLGLLVRVSASFQAVHCGSCLGGLESPEVATLRRKAELGWCYAPENRGQSFVDPLCPRNTGIDDD